MQIYSCRSVINRKFGGVADPKATSSSVPVTFLSVSAASLATDKTMSNILYYGQIQS